MYTIIVSVLTLVEDKWLQDEFCEGIISAVENDEPNIRQKVQMMYKKDLLFYENIIIMY